MLLKETEKKLKKNCTMIIGVSGGPDSMCLLNILNKLKNKLNIKIIAAHLDHKIRKESKNDAQFVEKEVRKLDLIFEKKEISVPDYAKKNKQNLEEAGRILRYKFFEDLKKKYNAKYIILGHHLNDSLETAILNFVRGSFLNFLIGIEEKPDILRPFLSLTKDEILDYAKKNKIKFVIDKTNLSTKYSRNLIRLNIIPELKKINANLEKTFLENSKLWKELDEYLISESQIFIQNYSSIPGYKKAIVLNLEKFLLLPIIFQKTVLNEAIKKIDKTIQLSSKNQNETIELIKNRKSGKKKLFFNKIEIKLIHKGISISKQ
jgi:tRNA(Ile)-lysidine synthase